MKLRMIVLSLLFLLGQISVIYAREMELTTYYPAPYGEYSTLSATDNLILPRLTKEKRDAVDSGSKAPLTPGMVIFNTTQSKLEVYDGTGWKDVGIGDQGGGRYAMSCYASNNTYTACFRIDTTNGAVTCRQADSWDSYPTWADRAAPFSATTLGNYSLSFIDPASAAVYPAVCRLNVDTGIAECKRSYDWLYSSWSSIGSPF